MKESVAKINLLFIISNLSQGGAERQFVELIKNINKRKFTVSVLLYAVQKEIFYKEILNFSDIVLKTKKLKSKTYFFKIIEAILCIKKELKNNRYDLVYTSLFMNNLFVRLVGYRIYKNRIVTSVRNNIKSYPIPYLLIEKIFIKSSYIVFNSHNSKIQFERIFKKKYYSRLFTIYNGFQTYRHYRFNLFTGNNIIFGCLGRQTRIKNFLQVAKVISKLNNQTTFHKLLIKGKVGDQTKQLNNYSIQNKNIIEYETLGSDIDNFFEKISVLVLPSKFEGCPNVIFESMLRNRLCLISKNANSDKFIEDGFNGFEYDGSESDLVEKISYIMKLKKNIQKKIIKNAFNYASKNFSLNLMINKYEKLFIDLYLKNESSNKSKNNSSL